MIIKDENPCNLSNNKVIEVDNKVQKDIINYINDNSIYNKFREELLNTISFIIDGGIYTIEFIFDQWKETYSLGRTHLDIIESLHNKLKKLLYK